MTVAEVIPIVELATFLADPASRESIEQCQKIADAFHQFGIAIIRDPRVTEEHNFTFLDQMEAYFGQDYDVKMLDARPECHFQVGVTPDHTETPRCTHDPECKDIVDAMSQEDKPHMPEGPDPKWRFFWRIGSTPLNTEFKQLNADPVIPKEFPKWRDTMDTWGNLMHQAVNTVSEMAALGFKLPHGAFCEMTVDAPHLLAPTGSDLGKYNELETIFAGFHYDLNFLTIHGKSRFPGLLIWSREGKRIQVRVPDGCLLVQAGKQMEYLTAGHVKAGFHEVVVLPDTLKAIEMAKAESRSLWRISSTLFFHIASDQTLKPLGHFASREEADNYPPIKAGHQVQKELESIKLKQ